MFDDTHVLDEHLIRVGMEKAGAVDLAQNLRAMHWSGSYAELFVVDAPDVAPEHLSDLLILLDTTIAKRLRSARDQGDLRDAHVCILVDSGALKTPGLQAEAEISRFVSRKYWIDRERPVEDILQRLTLSWVDVQLAFQNNNFEVSPELDDLRDRIAQSKGAGAAKDFLKTLS